MAINSMVDRFLKAFDTLKSAPLESAGDTPAKRRERLAACAQLADSVCASSLRSSPDFQKLLAVAIAGLLAGESDIDSDVRMNADECLNRVIKVVLASVVDIYIQREEWRAFFSHCTCLSSSKGRKKGRTEERGKG